MNRKLLLLTVGLPQSGKSTWAKKQGVPIVNPDSIRLALHGQPFIGLAEPFVWAIAKVMVRALFLAGHDKVIVDATNTTAKRRDEWKSNAWDIHFYVLCGPEMKATCMERARSSACSDEHAAGLVAAIERMAEQWEPLTEEESENSTIIA